MRVKKKKFGADENHKTVTLLIKGFLQCLSGKVKNLLASRRHGFYPWVRKIP